MVAVVVNAIGNPCEAEEQQLLVHALQARQLLPIILCCGDHSDRLQLMRLAATYQVDHVVVFSDMVSLRDAVDIFPTTKPIIVSFEPLDNEDVSAIRIDGSAAADEIVDRLVTNGKSRFTYLSGTSSSWIDKLRRKWFADALARRGLAFVADATGTYSYDSGFKEAVPLVHRFKTDAIICGNDVMAIGARDAVKRVLGKSVPEDVAVVGQDGIAMAALGLQRPHHAQPRPCRLHQRRGGAHRTTSRPGTTNPIPSRSPARPDGARRPDGSRPPFPPFDRLPKDGRPPSPTGNQTCVPTATAREAWNSFPTISLPGWMSWRHSS